MWWTGALVLALATPHLVNSLDEVEHGQDDDNFHLIIPLAIPDLIPTDDSVESTKAKGPDHDEPYSSIPAYAFTLDTSPVLPRAFGASYSQPRVEVMPSRSLYLGNQPAAGLQDKGINQRSHKKNSKRLETLRERRRNGCQRLAGRFEVEARETVLYLCTELVDVLSIRCDCCEQKQKKAKASPMPMPWFGPVGYRRHLDAENEPDEEPRQQVTV